MLVDLEANLPQAALQARCIAEKVRVALAQPYLLTLNHGSNTNTTVEHHCTVSIGVALLMDHKGSADDFLKWADIAMYKAKEAGRNTVVFHDCEA